MKYVFVVILGVIIAGCENDQRLPIGSYVSFHCVEDKCTELLHFTRANYCNTFIKGMLQEYAGGKGVYICKQSTMPAF